MTDLKIGAHVPVEDPLGEAEARGADVVQIFVSNPQSERPKTRNMCIGLMHIAVPQL